MKRNIPNLAVGLVALALAAATPFLDAAPPSHARGHRQSGIIGSVTGGGIVATPNGEGSYVLPNHVRVYSVDFPYKLVAEVETKVQGNVLWHFQLFLKPGHYLLVAYAPPAPEEGGQVFSYPIPVTVEKHQFTVLPPVSFAPQ